MAVVLGAFPALADLAGPAELPPSSYKGQQYVDSQGCVFLRAGYGGQVTWVPRVSRDRKQLCGYPPSGSDVAVASAEPAPQPAPEPEPEVVVAAPKAEKPAEKPVIETAKAEAAPAAPKGAPAAKPSPSPAPEPTIISAPAERPATPTELAATETRDTVAAPSGGAGFKLACPAETPVAERFEVRGGGSKVLCTRGDGNLDGATFPKLVEGSLDGLPIGYDAHIAAGTVDRPGVTTVLAAAPAPAMSSKSAKYPEATVPAGYKLAWKDGRLNPNRGKQTVDGFLAMDDIWTRTTPAELREDSTVKRRPVTIVVRRKDGTQTQHSGYVLSAKNGEEVVQFANPAEAPKGAKVSKSTKAVAPEAAPKAAPKADAGRFLVQVGTFGVPTNAEGAAGRLKGLGLPVARAKLKGGALTVVYAGPFGSAAEAKSALSAARGAGFGDAVIVQ
ncbi:MAG: SPOR domain-containing protein [Fuscovulum sp.]|nr:SPOR domain-containing protein [Fuscovulum sp.]